MIIIEVNYRSFKGRSGIKYPSTRAAFLSKSGSVYAT